MTAPAEQPEHPQVVFEVTGLEAFDAAWVREQVQAMKGGGWRASCKTISWHGVNLAVTVDQPVADWFGRKLAKLPSHTKVRRLE